MSQTLDERIRDAVRTIGTGALDPRPFPTTVPRNTPDAVRPPVRRRHMWLAAAAALAVLVTAVTVVALRDPARRAPVHRPTTTTTLPVGTAQYLRFRYSQRLDVRCPGGQAPQQLGGFDSAVVEVWRARDRTRQRVTYPDGSSRESIVLRHTPGTTHFTRGTGLAMRIAPCTNGAVGASGDEPGWFAGWSAPQVIWPPAAIRDHHRGHDRRGRAALIHVVKSPGINCSSTTNDGVALSCQDVPGSTSVRTLTVKTWFVEPHTLLPLEIARVEHIGAHATGRSWLVLTRSAVVRDRDSLFSTAGYTPSRFR
jgi:hypothetical protein